MDNFDTLTAISAIQVLKARYFRYVDAKDWDGLTTLFDVDARFDRTYGHAIKDPWTQEWTPALPPEPSIVHGRDAIIAMIRDVVGNIRTIHHGYMPEIEISGPDTANGIWAMSDELRTRDGRLILAGRGHYHDTYRLSDGRWTILSSKLTRLWVSREHKNNGEA